MKLIIEDGVTNIGAHAFKGCSSLIDIEIPEGITKIGWYAFEECSSLASIEISEGVTEIGNYAFSGCNSLKAILLRENLIDIGNLSIDIPIYTKPNSMAHKYAEENEQGYVLDEKEPDIKILVDKVITNKKQILTIPVEVKDNYEIVGVKEETIKYAINDSNVQVPPDGEFTNNVIDGKITYEMQEGKKYIWVMVEDNLGNRATAISEEINLDTKAPELEITYTPSGKTTQNVIVTIRANEEIQEIEGWTISVDMNENGKVDISDLLLLKREVAQNI